MSQRTFADIDVGDVHEVGEFVADRQEMLEFAKRYDPQMIHTDPVAAKDSIFGGLIASGWYTASCCMRLLVDGFFAEVISLGSFGLDELRWETPVRPGDTITVQTEIVDCVESESHDDRGYVTNEVTATNQDGDEIIYWTATNIIGTGR